MRPRPSRLGVAVFIEPDRPSAPQTNKIQRSSTPDRRCGIRGTCAICVTIDEKGHVHRWNSGTGQPITTTRLTVGDQTNHEFLIAPGGRHAISWSTETEASLWDLRRNQGVQIAPDMAPHQWRNWAFNRSGSLLCGESTGRLVIVDVVSRKTIRRSLSPPHALLGALGEDKFLVAGSGRGYYQWFAREKGGRNALLPSDLVKLMPDVRRMLQHDAPKIFDGEAVYINDGDKSASRCIVSEWHSRPSPELMDESLIRATDHAVVTSGGEPCLLYQSVAADSTPWIYRWTPRTRTLERSARPRRSLGERVVFAPCCAAC